MFSIEQCPICQGGLCGIRICGLDTDRPHGLVVCDECEAIWLQPDVKTEHQYPDSRDSRCPACSAALWGPHSRWADWEDVCRLGWGALIDPGLVWE